MTRKIEQIADLLGATIVAELPDAGGGAFGAARLGRLVVSLQSRLSPSVGRRPGRPTDARWVHHSRVAMSEDTRRKLARLAQLASTRERRVSPMQVAAQLLEDALARCDVE